MKKIPRRHKFKAQPVVNDGIRFDSKKEARYYEQLKLAKAGGLIVFFLRQIPFDLPGGVKYRCDFQIFYTDGTIRFVDVKGFETKDFIMKKKMVENLYPIKIEVVK